MKTYNKGVYPTMITPYTVTGEIDYRGVASLVKYYKEAGCKGIFAVCQSSEMNFLSLPERIKLAEAVLKESEGSGMNIVASGHVSTPLSAQIEEINELAKTGIDAFVLVSNRFDIHNEGDDAWIENAKRVLDKIPMGLDLGIYECPTPYKRLLTDKIIDFCLETGRFRFIKDTCCDPVELTHRCEKLKNTDIMLFNANAQTLLHSLKAGASGYSGIMANFHPEMLVWLCENFEKQPEKAERISEIISMTAFTENPAYPGTAKYYLSEFKGMDIALYSRSKDRRLVTEYQKLCMGQLYRLSERIIKEELI